MGSWVSEYESGWTLPQRAYVSDEDFASDLTLVWQREWVLATVEAAIPEAGDYERVRLGATELLMIRNVDGEIHAVHNVCRHRGSQLCTESTGHFRNRIVCPYHQWAYDLSGHLVKARAMADDFDDSAYALGRVSCRSVGGLVFVCLADDPPPFEPFSDVVEPYLQPFDLHRAAIAHRTVTVEQGNWKLVMENNRECYHCPASHPELMKSFPQAPLHSGNASPEESAPLVQMVAELEAIGLASRYEAAADSQYRVMRMPFLPGVSSMTLDGQPAVQRRFPGLPDRSIGDLLLYHYPSLWSHFQADHCLVFRVEPLTATTTQLTSYWLVPEGSVEGVDYDLRRLTEVWEATNAQDTSLVERAQRGVSSSGYRPGPYAPEEEVGVIQFVDWYVGRLKAASA